MRALPAAVIVAVAPAHAQRHDSGDRIDGDSVSSTWLDRVTVVARYGTFRPARQSVVYSLIDRALTPGSRALRPSLVGGELHVRMVGRWGLLLGAESGSSTVASVSRAQPASASGDVRQQTTLGLSSVQYVGGEWQALRWRRAHRDAPDRLRVVLGAGGGVARYRLRQWGDFVDAERGVAFENDFRSAGRGGFGYASAGVDVPLRGWIALEGELRRQAGSAPMSADYATFDRLDLGGTRFSVGLQLRPGGGEGRR
jgi:hypothetical protein